MHPIIVYRRFHFIGFCLLFLTIVHLGCNPVPQQQDNGATFSKDEVQVVATTSIITDLVSIIGGEKVQVHGLMGPGVDPHLYKASEGDVLKMAQADLIFYNGLHLEGKMSDVFAQMSKRGVPAFAIAQEAIPDTLLIRSENFSGTHDPHVWFDVSLWQRCAQSVRDILANQMPQHSDYFKAQTSQYLQELMELDIYVKERANQVPSDQRVLVTSHDAFGYFGKAYQFEVHALQGLSTVAEAGTADVQQLADFVTNKRIPAIFVESSVSPRGIEAVIEAVAARDFTVDIGGNLFSDALGDPASPEGTYIGTVTHNINTIVDALSTSNSPLSE